MCIQLQPQLFCIIPGCNKVTYTKNICYEHYMESYNSQSPIVNTYYKIMYPYNQKKKSPGFNLKSFKKFWVQK